MNSLLFFFVLCTNKKQQGGIYTDIRELKWLRNNAHKFDKELRARILTQHRAISKFPCIFQNLYRRWYNRFQRLPVIIQFSPMRSAEEKEQVQRLLRHHGKIVHDLKMINSVSARLSVKSIKNIAQESGIAKIYLDREVRALLNHAVPSVKADLVWEKEYTGRGVTIAIVDTGVYPHPDFLRPESRIIAFKDFVNNKTEAYDDNGHGTHCAGAALGNGFASDGQYRGPAFNASLAGVKALNKYGAESASTIIKGLEWCLLNRELYNIRIVSLSLGYKASDSYREDPVCQAVGKLVEAGIAVFVAAGNDGPEGQTINSPGIHPAVITVGASDDKNTGNIADDEVAEFSSRGPTVDGLTKPDLLAPGPSIISAKAKKSLLAKTSGDDTNLEWYMNLSGTSMATPLCAGVGAQILEAYPELTPQQLKDKLSAGAIKISIADANTQGSGLVNAIASVSEG